VSESAAPGAPTGGANAPSAAAPLPGFLGKLDQDGIATLIARLALGGVFIHHGWVKIVDPIEKFLKPLKTYGILPLEPPWILNSVAVVLPWVELVAGVLIVCGIARRASASILFAMLAVFTPAVLHFALQYQGEHPEIPFHRIVLDCGCGSGPVNIVKKLVENTGLLLLALWLIVSRSRRFVFRPFL